MLAALSVAALALCAACGGDSSQADPSIVPTPIGRGAAFQPAARAPAPETCEPGPVEGRFRAHVELFAERQAVVVPAGIGLGPPLRREHSRIVGADCRAPARTLDPSGVVDFDGELRLRDLFGIWREPLGPTRLLSFRGPVSVFVGGEPVKGDPGALVLHDGDQVVLEVGGYVPPHRTYAFPPRD